ncbi:hypothetical protein SG34_003620 [Thalassomonas viridans]|uniref:Uncharacterized protein n=1 Tax=Thalassomonas viridans TaxID=137584 RepID=A0AAF0CA82_9GAMM|nr:hypothetical protein [Thalassomonas viridans]WDE06030.1 hypothetical protein SG34_003620 [Thalassomonas viridans]
MSFTKKLSLVALIFSLFTHSVKAANDMQSSAISYDPETLTITYKEQPLLMKDVFMFSQREYLNIKESQMGATAAELIYLNEMLDEAREYQEWIGEFFSRESGELSDEELARLKNYLDRYYDEFYSWISTNEETATGNDDPYIWNDNDITNEPLTWNDIAEEDRILTFFTLLTMQSTEQNGRAITSTMFQDTTFQSIVEKYGFSRLHALYLSGEVDLTFDFLP